MALYHRVDHRLRVSVPLLPSIILGLALLVLAWPSQLADFGSVAYPALLATFVALSLYACTRAQQPLVAVLVLLTGAAYAPGLGDATVYGAILPDVEILPTAANTRDAVWMLLFFLAIAAVVSWLFVPAWQAVLPRARPEETSTRRAFALGLGALIAVSFVASWLSGAWTDYGGVADDARNGSFRLEYFYDPALLSGFSIVASALVEAYAQRRKTSYRLLWTLLGILFGLIFMRQVRRNMIFAVVFAVVLLVSEAPAIVRLLRSPRQLGTLSAALAAIGVIVVIGSAAWRKSALRFQTNSVTSRMSDTVGQLGSLNERRTLRKDRDRLTYLWLDASTIQAEPQIGGSMSLENMFVGTVINNLPGTLFPDKYRYDVPACEDAFTRLGILRDLPCTAQAEGFIAGGVGGVAFVAFVWGIVLALATVLFRRRTLLGQILAIHIIVPLVGLETSAFPMVRSVRLALLGGVAVVLLASLARLAMSPRLRVHAQVAPR